MRYMLTLALLCALALAGAATAAPPRVIAHASSQGDFASVAVHASKRNASAIYVRGIGRNLAGFASVACSRGIASIGSKSTTLQHMTSGRLYPLRLPFRGGNCQVVASLTGAGRITLQIVA
jgi:hypothetical protein